MTIWVDHDDIVCCTELIVSQAARIIGVSIAVLFAPVENKVGMAFLGLACVWYIGSSVILKCCLFKSLSVLHELFLIEFFHSSICKWSVAWLIESIRSKTELGIDVFDTINRFRAVPIMLDGQSHIIDVLDSLCCEHFIDGINCNQRNGGVLCSVDQVDCRIFQIVSGVNGSSLIVLFDGS